jgi:Na+/H+ antiporter NhaD/arsenite permease-like protein
VTTGQVLFGLLLIVLGILLILDNVNLIDFDFGIIWPLAIIFGGLYIIIRGFEDSQRKRQIIREGEKVE